MYDELLGVVDILTDEAKPADLYHKIIHILYYKSLPFEFFYHMISYLHLLVAYLSQTKIEMKLPSL